MIGSCDGCSCLGAGIPGMDVGGYGKGGGP